MDDLISRKMAIDALEEPCKVSDTWTDEYAVGERMQWEKDVKVLNSLPSAQPAVVDENLQFTEQEKEFLCMLFSLCNEMLGMKGRYMEIDYKPFGYNELFELSQKLKIDY